MSFFSELRQLTVMEPIAESVARGKMIVQLDRERKPFVKQIAAYDPTAPWLHSHQEKARKCSLWNGIYFMEYGLIPRGCHACWKCVTKPKSLKQVFEIKKLQEDMGINSKVGLETRGYVPGLWHAYWYSPLDGGLEKAREIHKKVKFKVKEVLGVQQKVILKHACTEMELKWGPSDKWVYTKKNEELEGLLDSFFRLRGEVVGQHPLIQANAMRKWIMEAWSRGDPTVWEYADPSDFVAGPVTYEESSYKDEDFPHGRLEKAEGESDESRGSRILRLSENE